jgi:hypothetical protein
VIKVLLWLVVGAVLFWALVTYTCWLLWPGDQILIWSTTAAVLTLAPTTLTLTWAFWAFREKPDQRLLAVFGGATIRMAVVLAISMILFLNVEAFGRQRFLILVILYYLFTLGLEMVLIVRQTAAGRAAPKN